MVIWQGHSDACCSLLCLCQLARRQVHLVTAITLNWQFEHAHCSSTVWMSTSLCKVRKSHMTRVKASLCFENLVDPRDWGLFAQVVNDQVPTHQPTSCCCPDRRFLRSLCTLCTQRQAPTPPPPIVVQSWLCCGKCMLHVARLLWVDIKQEAIPHPFTDCRDSRMTIWLNKFNIYLFVPYICSNNMWPIWYCSNYGGQASQWTHKGVSDTFAR